MHSPVTVALHQVVSVSRRQRRATCSRCLIAQAVFWVCLLSWTASFAAAQGGADVSERFRQATAAMREGHLDEASEGFAAIVKETPSFAEAHLNLGLALQEQNRFDDAIAEYQAAIKLVPAQSGLHEELGSEYRNLGKMPEAEEAFRRELEIDPNNAVAKYKLGELTVEKGDGAKGKELMEAAMRVKPGLLHADYNLGRAEMLLGNDAAAARHLERATAAAGSDPEVIEQSWYQLGIVYRRLHRMEETQKAKTICQKLKDQEAESSQKALKRYEVQQNPNSAQPPPSPQNPQ